MKRILLGLIASVFFGTTANAAINGNTKSINGVAIPYSVPVTGTDEIKASNPLPVSSTPAADAVTTGTITIQDTGSSSAAGQASVNAITGTPTAASYVSAALTGDTSVAVLITGTWTGTLTFERSSDSGTTWAGLGAHQSGSSITVGSVTGNGNFISSVPGATNYRVRATAAITGTATVRLLATGAAGVVYINNPIKILDGAGTTNQATVKAASTLAAATDPALVVTLSPNLPSLPAGTNLLGKVGIDQTTPGTTNGVQVNAALPAGTNLIGKMGIDQTTPGTTNGVQVNAALPAGTNVIGHTITDTTSTTAVTQATGTNLHAVLDTTSTTAATQATASNLNAQVVGNVASGATDSGNPAKVGGVFNTAGSINLTTGQRGDLQQDAKGSAKVLLVDGNGTTIDPTATANTYDLNDAANAAPMAGTGNASVTSATTLFSLDTTGYNGVSIQVTSAGSTCTITYEASNDNATWVSIAGLNSASTGSNIWTTTSTTAISLGFPAQSRYFRARVSTYTSGTVTAYYALRRSITLQLGQTTIAGNVASAATDSGSPVKTGSVFNTTQPTVTTGQRVDSQATNRGALIVATGVDAFTVTNAANGSTGSAVPATATQIGASDGTNLQALKITADKGLMVTPVSPAAASILDGRQTFSATTGATTLITVTAGKTWIGTIGASVDCNEVAAATAACKANATFTTTGANMTPAAGTYFACQATSGANAATGVTGTQGANFCSVPFTAVCASGTCTIAVATTQAGTASLVEAFAVGIMQ